MIIKVCSVAVLLPITKPYSYAIPKEFTDKIKVGSIVRVTVKNRPARGCVLSISEINDEEKTIFKYKPVTDVITPDYTISEPLLNLGKWITEYYLSFPGSTYSCISFIGFNEVHAKLENALVLKNPEVIEELLNTENPETDLRKKTGFTLKQIQALECMIENENEPLSRGELTALAGVSDSVIAKLIEQGILEVIQEEKLRLDPYAVEVEKSYPLKLNPDQEKAFREIEKSINENEGRAFLLHGVTGSGKTEIYLQAMALCLDQGKQVIVLLPEISLTPQTVERFRARFGNIVGVYHSKLSIGQKFDLYRQIQSGEIKIVVGARSALFTPFEKLGLIIVDEEHEKTFKQDTDPRYQSRDVAVMRGHLEKAAVILGSATPSLESYHNALSGKYALLSLPSRVEDIPMPSVSLIDMSAIALEQKSDEVITPELKFEIDNVLEKKEQAILFINRRGFFNFYTCMKCRMMLKCKSCDQALTYHKTQNVMLCHLCGKKYNVPEKCPFCGSESGTMIGAGIQRIEEELKEKFPKARVLRIDLDTTQTKNSFLEKWRMINNNEVDIILGTQMIAKGFHLENVTLVGVVMADIGLHLPDFRATERTFSLMMQVAGRAGRGSKPGKVLIQTYYPEHYALNWAKEHNYESFAEKELRIRSLMQFPPHYKLVSIILSGRNKDQVSEMANKAAGFLRELIYKRQEKKVFIIGPAPSPISKIRGAFRFRILLRGSSHSIIRKYIQTLIEDYEEWPNKSIVRMVFDVDPFDLL